LNAASNLFNLKYEEDQATLCPNQFCHNLMDYLCLEFDGLVVLALMYRCSERDPK
jgi:hypothetical protein